MPREMKIPDQKLSEFQPGSIDYTDLSLEELYQLEGDEAREALWQIRLATVKCQKCWLFNKNEELHFIGDDCVDDGYGLPVSGVGSHTAGLMIIGEAPGKDEVYQGKPFVGRAGALLREAIAESGLDANEVYISNVIHCRPPNNKFPDANIDEVKETVQVCRPWLFKEIAIIKPFVILGCGSKPLRHIAKSKGKITETAGKKRQITFGGFGHSCYYMATLHPSFCLRPGRDFHLPDDLLADWQKVASLSPSQKQDLLKEHLYEAARLAYDFEDE